MNKIIALLFCCLLCTSLTAQDKHFKFDQPFYNYENKYVILPNEGGYVYGLMLVEKVRGFTFLHIGSFTMEPSGKAKNVFDEKFKSYLLPNYARVAPLPEKLFKEFGLEKYSNLEDHYISEAKTEVVEDIVTRGIWYVKADGYEPGISILLKAYAKDPHAEALEAFLGMAYIKTKQYDKALTILQKAIVNAPKDSTLYELSGEAYFAKGNYAEGDKMYKNAIGTAQDSYKKELSFFVTNFYYEKKDKQRFAEWVKIARQYFSNGDSYLDSLAYMERKLNE